MKTNADLSPPEINNTCARDRAFTLTDLLAVMATLAILAALILPALAKSGDNGMRMVCLNNLRQLGTALNMYAGENQDYMPWPSWGTANGCPSGWLYGQYNGKNNPNNPDNIQQGLALDTANWPSYRVDNLGTGTYWQYLHNADVFICPVFAVQVVGTMRWDAYANKLSTYCMNGASCFFPGADGTSANLYGYRTCKASQIWSPLCIIQWEPSGTSGVGNGYNDGANYPDSNEGPSTAFHVTGATVLAVGGSSRLMSFADIIAEMHNPAQTGNCSGVSKGLLWWNPLRCDGHGKQE